MGLHGASSTARSMYGCSWRRMSDVQGYLRILTACPLRSRLPPSYDIKTNYIWCAMFRLGPETIVSCKHYMQLKIQPTPYWFADRDHRWTLAATCGGALIGHGRQRTRYGLTSLRRCTRPPFFIRKWRHYDVRMCANGEMWGMGIGSVMSVERLKFNRFIFARFDVVFESFGRGESPELR